MSKKVVITNASILFCIALAAGFLLIANQTKAISFSSTGSVSFGNGAFLSWLCDAGSTYAQITPNGSTYGTSGTNISSVPLTNNTIFKLDCGSPLFPFPVEAYSTTYVTGTGGQSCNSGTPAGGSCGPVGDVCYGSGLWQCWSSAYPVLYLNGNPGTVNSTVGGAAPAPLTFSVFNLNSSNPTAYWSASSDQSWCHVANPANPPSFVDMGSTSYGSPTNLTIYLDTLTTPGAYTCLITFTNWFNAPNSAAISNVPYQYILHYSVNPASPPTVTLSANPTSVATGGSSLLTWTTTNATSCTASGAWSGSKATGVGVTQNITNITTNSTYNISCIGAGGTANASATVQIKPSILLSPTTFNFSGVSGGSTPGSQSMTISDPVSGTTLKWQASTNQSWCHVSPTTGTAPNGSPSTVTISVDSPSNVGSFICTVTVADNGSSPAVAGGNGTATVNYSVVAGSCPSAGASQVQLSATTMNVGQSGVTASAPAGFSGGTFSSSNSGVASLSSPSSNPSSITGVSAGTATISGSGWTYTPNSATGCSLSNSATLTVSVVPTYSYTVTPSLPLSATQNGSGPTGNITITNTGNQSLNINASEAIAWASISQSSFTLAPGANTTVTVTVTDTSMAPNTYSGSVDFTNAQGAGNHSTNVSLTITIAACTSLTYHAATSGFSTSAAGPSGSSLSVTPGQTFYAFTDYNQSGIDSIQNPSASGAPSCTFDTYVGTAARFICTAAATPNTYTYTTGTNGGTSSNTCASGPTTMGNVTVTSGPTYSYTVTPSLPLSATQNGSGPTGNITITNTGNQSLNINASEAIAWASISQSSFTLAPGANTTVTVTVTDTSMAPNTYSGSVDFTNAQGAGNHSTNVSLTINPAAGGNPPLSPTAVNGGVACGQIRITWAAPSGGTPTGYQVWYSNSNNFAFATSVSGLLSSGTFSYIHTPADPTNNYYWVTADYSGVTSAAAAPPQNPIATVACQANISNSDKDIIALNGTAIGSNSPCTGPGSDAIPASVTFKAGDIVAFEINVCNVGGAAAASGISVVDNLINLTKPSAGWGMVYNNGSGNVSIPDASIAASGTDPNKQLAFSVPDVPAGSYGKITFNAVITAPPGITNGSSRYINSAQITYAGGPAIPPFSTGAHVFNIGAGPAIIHEQP